ncbi:MAG: DUF3095 domain-containing protein [Nitratireductor sp.]|uniref:DUF3095 domain-containing protein n=1 Tax=Parasphingorhabdus sp. TaxID=2709688 RepID=UPI0032670825
MDEQSAGGGALGSDFYGALPVHAGFEDLADGTAYRPVPDDWFVGTADIVGSTDLIAAGRYKVVNTVGAAVISAQINAAGGMRFPFVFGGDGAGFGFEADRLEAARDALARVIGWARREFDIEMRGAIVPVGAIRAAGHELAVARYAPSPGVDYAMFSGGGMAWAEGEMKQGRYRVEAAPADRHPDLAGLSCRWTPMRARHGRILSLLAIPRADAPAAAVADAMRRIIRLTVGLERGGHPVPAAGPGFEWPPLGLELEARARRGGGSLILNKLRLLAETLFALLLFRTGRGVGGFDPGHYVETTSANADFRKFDDGLKMTIDCDAETREKLEALLAGAAAEGVLDYGLFEQDEAIMTCIVPSVSSDDHVHFVDGASGGYTTAALAIKGRG